MSPSPDARLSLVWPQVLTEGVGSNSIDIYDDLGDYQHTATKLSQDANYGSSRYIDWLLVDLESARTGRVRVLRAEVHTAEGTRDGRELALLPPPRDREGRGWGSDHFPISADIEIGFRGK